MIAQYSDGTIVLKFTLQETPVVIDVLVRMKEDYDPKSIDALIKNLREILGITTH